MATVRSRNTGFELRIIRTLSAELYPLGYRYRKHYRAAKGTPDIAFMRQRIAVFFDSDFWHGRNYDRSKWRMNDSGGPRLRNMERDRQVNSALRRDGWSVLRFGESQSKVRSQSVVRKVRAKLEARKR